MNSNNDATTEFYNDLVLATAIRLIKDEGYTTTLDIKEELRIRHALVEIGSIIFRPNFTQNMVSDAMAILADRGFFSYTNNSKYKTYSLNTDEFEEEEVDNNQVVYLNVLDSINLISALKKNENITATFTKHDGSIRTIIGTVYTPNTGLGLMRVYDIELPDGDDGNNIRTIELRKLISFVIKSVTYIVDRSIK